MTASTLPISQPSMPGWRHGLVGAVVANPPYWRVIWGRPCTTKGAPAGRHSMLCE